MSDWLLRVLMFAAVAWTYMWMLSSAPDRQTMVLFQFNVFVPLLLILGVAGLTKALYMGWHGAYRNEVEGLAAFSFLAVAWGHDNGWALIRRAADTAGYDPAWMLQSDYRLFSGSMVILAILLVLRWATRREFSEGWIWSRFLRPDVAGEIPWVAVAICLMGSTVYQTATFARFLVWIYEQL